MNRPKLAETTDIESLLDRVDLYNRRKLTCILSDSKAVPQDGAKERRTMKREGRAKQPTSPTSAP